MITLGFYSMAVVAHIAIARGFYLTKKLRELENVFDLQYVKK